ncbi:MAG: LysM peptidoglycan-binding domain-containing protein, partial [Verrucomicrobiota bacterium]
QFRAGVYAVLITATILIMGMLIQGCRTQQSLSAGAAIQPVVRPDLRTPRQATNPLPTPMAQTETAAETNWITPQSASLPENVTLPEPGPTPVAQSVPPAPAPLLATQVHKASAHHAHGVYVVKSGDTLSRIARAHGTTVKALKTANHLSSDRIFAGEKLKLSQAKSVTSNSVHS